MKTLSVVLALLCATASAECRTDRRDRRVNRLRGDCGDTSSTPGFDAGTPALQYVFPSLAARLPTCTATENCVGQVGIGVRTGSLTAWESVLPDGGSFGTITDPGGGTVVDSFAPNVRALDVTGATGPKMSSSALDAIFGATTAHTLIMAGMGRSSALLGFNFWIANSTDSTGGIQYRGQSGLFNCIDYAVTTSAPVDGVNGYSIAACRRNGGTGYESDINSSNTAATSGTAVPNMTGDGEYYFGTRWQRDLNFYGPLMPFTFYSDNKSDTWLAHQRARLWGSYSDAGVLTGGVPQLTGLDNTSTTGNVDMMYPGAHLVTDAGLLTSMGHTNVWAADALAASTWTDVGTPTVTSGVSSGPFALWKGSAECALIVDDDAAAFEGKQGATAGTTAQYYNASCYLKAGTSGTTTTKARIAVTVAGGTGSVNCDFTGLTSTASRKVCPIQAVGGGITSVRASVLVGNSAAETGSIQSCQCQLTATIAPEPPEPDNTVHSATYYQTTSAASWPDPSTGGKYELIHTPLFNPSVDWNAAQGTYYIFDASNAGDSDHTVALIFGYTVPGRVLAVVRNAGTTSDLTIDGISLTPGQLYASAVEWRPVGGGKCNLYVRHNACPTTSAAACRAETIIGSDLTGLATCPEQPAKLTIGNRYNGAVPTSGHVSAIRVYP